MDLYGKTKKYLYNETIGQLPIDNQNNVVPALLFSNSKNSRYFGDMYLFSNFGISGGNTITASSELTNNYVENNSQRQDHWAIHPLTYTLTGYIGEVVYKPASKWSNWLEDKVTNYLEPLSIISPTVSNYVGTAMNTVHQIEANYQKYSKYAENIMNSIDNMAGKAPIVQSNVHKIFTTLKVLRDSRTLVDVYTPYGTFKDMAMVNISMSEDEKSKYKSKITVTLQEYKSVESYVALATDNEIKQLVKSEVVSQQSQEEKNNGIANLAEDAGKKSLSKILWKWLSSSSWMGGMQ